MISRRIRTTSAAAVLVTAAALGVVPEAAQAAAPAGSGAAAAPIVTPAGAGAAAVVLPTGDVVRVGTGAGAASGVAVQQQPGGSDAFASVQIGGDRYVIPSEAAPYVGRSLDLSLFDVTKQAAAGLAPDAHIPVQLTFAAGAAPSAPAGVTVTSVSGRIASGYLTPESGKVFAQALRDAIKADVAAGHRAGTTAPFGGLTSMAAAGATTPVQPFYPLHILQVNALDSTGAPASMPIILFNADSARIFAAQVITSGDGVGKVAVPAGNYGVLAFDFSFDAQAKTSRTAIVSQDGISVPATGTVPVATVDERTATSPITFTTQKPATQAGGYVQIERNDPDGSGAGLTLLGGSGPTYISPEAKPATGSMSLTLNWVGTSPATAASPYRYNLAEMSDHIDANQAYAPADSSLATLHNDFDLDPAYGPNEPSFGSAFITPAGWGMTGIPVQGTSVTEYVTGGLQWFSEMSLPQVYNPTNPTFTFGILDDDAQLYRAGQNAATRTWAHAPEAPNFGRHAASATQYGCQACAAAGNLNVTLGMLGDSNRDTTGIDFTAAGTSQLYWNGQLISSDTDHFGYLLQKVQGPGTVRTVFDYDRPEGISQSTKTHTDVTIPYSGQSDPSLTLPSGVDCTPADAAGTPAAACQILPALTLNYQLDALSATNTSHSPRQNLVLHVGHLSYGGVGSHAHIGSVQVSVSFDNGATWQDAPTHGGDGTYTAHWANPAAGSPVELRVTATDCLGGSITQTVTNPYTVG